MQALSRMTLETSLGFVCAVRCGRAFSVLGSIQHSKCYSIFDHCHAMKDGQIAGRA